MSSRRTWSRDELLLAMNLYCQLPFGRLHRGTPEIIKLATAINRTPSSVAMKLSNLASLDPVHQERGIKGLSGASQLDREIWQEFHRDWERLAAESESLRLTKMPSEDSPVESPLFNPDRPTESRTLSKVRLAQGFFRKTILASYDLRCCVTGLSIPSLLVASHILPWNTHPEHRADPHNGLCLSSMFDKAFDSGLIAFDDEYRLLLSRTLIDKKRDDQAVTQFFVPFEGARLRVPTKFLPRQEFLKKHRQFCFQG